MNTPRLAVAILGLAAVACGLRPAPRRIVVLGLDGLDPQTVDLLVSEGKLPSFARLKQQGAFGRLTGHGDLLISPVIWTTIATGKPPDQHGINHFVTINEKTGQPLPVTSRMRKVKAVWDVASSAGRTVGVVGWWATWPAESVNGWVVSDHTCYHFLFGEGAHGGKEASGLTWPPQLIDELAPLVRRPADVTPEEAARFVSVDAKEFARPFDFADPLSHFRWALASADSYKRIGLRLLEKRPDLLMVYVEGTDSVAHLFGHLFRAQGLAGELALQQKRYGSTVEQMYLYADQLVGEYLKAMDAATTLVVLSDHGFDLGVLPDDPGETRDLRRVSEKHHRPEGILYLHGRGVKRGASLERPDHLDVAPTLLALLGIGKAKDMPGRVLAEALDIAIPEPVVATYESGAPRSTAGAADTDVDPEILARLKSLGYLDTTSSPQADQNVAERRFQEGNYDQAETIYLELLKKTPWDAGLHTSLAGALAGQEKYEDALRELKTALEIDPLQAPAYHNRGAIYEFQGKRDAAIKEYRTALRYKPEYAPSREALARLGGSPAPQRPRTDGETRADALAERARDAAQRGDNDGALKLLEQAEGLAPRLAKLYQYEANVAYLKGDRARAITALNKALRLEPDNALFASNLKALQDQKP
jgi:tetratricopeptide (TPR) repeat protein